MKLIVATNFHNSLKTTVLTNYYFMTMFMLDRFGVITTWNNVNRLSSKVSIALSMLLSTCLTKCQCFKDTLGLNQMQHRIYLPTRYLWRPSITFSSEWCCW